MHVYFAPPQHSEEIYDPEIYRHQLTEYYNSYVLDQDIQTGEWVAGPALLTAFLQPV